MGYECAESALADGSALRAFFKMVNAHGGNVAVFDNPNAFHQPEATLTIPAWQTGYIHSMDTTALGWAVQRTGAGREKAGEPVDPHAGIDFHSRRGDFVEKGRPLATIYASEEKMLVEPAEILSKAILFSPQPPAPVPLVSRVFTVDSAKSHLARLAHP
jgi:pyrimidine-nucleoside phosphorylase